MAATKRHTDALKLVDALDKKVIRDEKELEKHLQFVAAAEQEVASSMRERVYTAQQLTKSVNDQTRATKDLTDENQSFTKRLRQVNTLVGKNKKEFRDLTRITNQQRRELEGLHSANLTVAKDNTALARQLDRVSAATKKTREERKKYNEMVKEGTATYKQYREQSERVRNAHEAERKVIGDTRTALDGLIHSFDQHNVVVDANRTSLRNFSQTALDTRKQMEALRAAHLGVIRDNATLSRSFAAVGDVTDKAFREHQKYNKMTRDASVSQDELRRQLDRTNDAYARQSKTVNDAREALRRHERQQAIAAANRAAGTGRGGGGGGDSRHLRFDPGRWAARNLGALTPLGMVTPTLVLPLGTAFTQVANAAVAASQSIALLPAVVTAAGAAFGTLKMATAGFSDTVGALMSGDLEKFATLIQNLSPAAQQTALTIQNLLPQLKGMQQAAQEAFFAGAPQMVFSLTKTLGPVVQDMTTSIATSMNKMMMDVGNMLLSPEGMSDVSMISENIAKSFQALEPAVTAVAHAFLDLTSVGSSFLPIMADDIAEVAKEFAKFISNARDSGALRDFMFQGWEAIKAVGGALKGFGKMLYDVFGLKSQNDVQEFRDTMQEMTDVLEVLLRTMKTVFEDIAGIFTQLADFVGIFGVDLQDTASILATVAEAWLFLHGIKWAKDFLGVIKEVKIAMAGMAGVNALSGAAGVAGAAGGAAASAGGGAAGAAIGRFATLLGGLTNPITLATGAIVALGGAAIWATHKLSMTDFQEQTTPTIPGTNTPKPGLIPGTGGIPFPKMTADEEARIKVMTGGKDPHEIPIEQLYKMLGRPVPAAPPAATGGPGLGSGFDPGQTPGHVPWFDVPPMPTKPGDFQSTPGTFEMSNIPIGQFGGAQWNVPPGITDLPPDYQNLGKTGFYRPDQYKIFQEQTQADEARVRVEEQRIAYLAKQADANATQDDINKAANDVIAAEHDWLNAQRELKEAERGEFTDLTSQTSKFSDDLRDSLGDLGAALDPDLGISKGLAGMAENLVKFVGSLAAAPVLGAMKGMQAGLGFPGNKGVGSGLIGMAAASRGYYESPYSSEDLALQQLAQQYGLVIPGLNGNTPTSLPNTGGLPAGTSTDPTGSVAQQIIGLAQRSSGGQYDWGGSDLAAGLSDCSGAVSDLVEVITKGRANSGRLFNAGPGTREALTNLGAVEGAVPGALQIGWQVGGPGGGHMRATLPNGVPFESGGGTGQGATYGGSAKGAAGMPNIMSIPIPGGSSSAAPAAAPAAPGGHLANWPAIMGPEAGGSGGWQANTGNGYYGGLQFTQSSWDASKPPGAPARADLATPEQQMAAADKLLQMQGPGAWPATSAAHPEWFRPTAGAPPAAPSTIGGVPAPVGVPPAASPTAPIAHPPGYSPPGSNPYDWKDDPANPANQGHARGGWVGFDDGGSVGGPMFPSPYDARMLPQSAAHYGGPLYDPLDAYVGSGKYNRPPIPGVVSDPTFKGRYVPWPGSMVPFNPRFNPNMKIDTSHASSSFKDPGMPFWGNYEAMLNVGTAGGYAKGGGVPGPTDTVPAMLTPGEFVVRAPAAQQHAALLEHINGYSGGGPVDPFDLIGGGSAPSSGSSANPLDVFAPTKPPKPPPYPGTAGDSPYPGPPPGPGGPPPPAPAPLPGVPPVEGVPHLPAEGPPGLPGPPMIGGVPSPVGVPTEGAPIGAQVDPPEGYGEGAKFNGGGIIGAAIGAGQGAASAMPGMGAAASAALQIGVQEIQRAIEFGAQAAGIGVQGLMETFLPTGASELAQNSWFTRIAGGIAGAAPALPNLAGGLAKDQLGKGAAIPGVGPPTPEQVAAQALDPNRTGHTGTGPPPGPVSNTGVNIENYNVAQTEDRAGQDLARYQPMPGAR